jgi:hypothetical protein
MRARTGDGRFYSSSEMEGETETEEKREIQGVAGKGLRVLGESLLRPLRLMREPVVFYVNLYIALTYGIFYRESPPPPPAPAFADPQQYGSKPSHSSTSTSTTLISASLGCPSLVCS